VAESLTGDLRDEGLGTERECVPLCPHILGATVSHKTVNGLRVVLDCTLFGDYWHEGMPKGLHECGTGRLGLPSPEPEPRIICIWCSIINLISVSIGSGWGFCRSLCLHVRDHREGESWGLLVCTAPIGIGKTPRGVRRSLTRLSG
jgi:hypothetical protein